MSANLQMLIDQLPEIILIIFGVGVLFFSIGFLKTALSEHEESEQKDISGGKDDGNT